MTGTPDEGPAKPARAPKTKAKYVLRWWEGDQRRQASFDRKKDRDDFKSELRRIQQARGVIDVGQDVTLNEFIEDYWVLHAVPNLEPATRTAYMQQWGKWIQPRLGSYKLRAITAKVINRQLAQEMRRLGAGDPTIRYVLAVLQSILRLAVAEGRVPDNAAAAVRKPRQHVSREVAPVLPEVVERMRLGLGVRDATIVSLLAYAGLRPQEALALRVEDILGDVLLIHRKNVDGEIRRYTKTRKNRKPPLYPWLSEDLVAYQLATGLRTGLLFPTPRGTPWRKHDYDNWRERVFTPAAEAVGLDGAVPYDLRGSSVSLQVWEGRNMLEVAWNHGHGVDVCERHYARIFEGYDPAQRTSAEVAVRAARRKLSGEQTLFDVKGDQA